CIHTSTNPLQLTPFKIVDVELLSLPALTPEVAILTINNRNPELADAYRVNLSTCALELAATNPGNFIGYTADLKNRIRAATAIDSAGHYSLWTRDSEQAPWRMVKWYSVEDRISPHSFS